MNSDAHAVKVVTVELPSGLPVRVELADLDSADGMTSVGLGKLDLKDALDAVGEIGTAVVGKLKAARPTKATVELKLGFTVESGKLTALWVSGKGEASMTVTLEWSGDHTDSQDGPIMARPTLPHGDSGDDAGTAAVGDG